MSMRVIGIHTSIFKLGDNLIDFICKYIPQIHEKDVIVITSKIVALSENSVIPFTKKNSFLKKMCKDIISTPWAELVYWNDEWLINGGVDESNANNCVITLPRDMHYIARKVRSNLRKNFGIKDLGILITDTRSVPLRQGTIGRAIGYAGFDPLYSYISKDDLYGRKSRITRSNHADALASAAVLIMGEGNESIPLVRITDAPVVFRHTHTQSLSLLPENDIFQYVYKKKMRRN